MAVRLVLAEDHYLLREGMRQLLAARPEIELLSARQRLFTEEE